MDIGNYRKHEIPKEYITKWQNIVDQMANVFEVPAGLIMRVWEKQIEVLVSSVTEGNPYKVNEKADLGTGLYCETVMASRDQLYVPNSLHDEHWKDNPDVALDMISYLGVPLITPNDQIFGTICILDNHTSDYSETYQRLLWEFKGIIERDFALIDKTEQLRMAMEDMAESRKMAALGKLVAGISHEINTPLGVSISSASILKNLQQQAFQSGGDAEAMEEILEQEKKATALLESNLKRAAKLLKSFQQIAVDQMYERLQDIDLGSYLQHIVSALSIELDNNNVSCEIAAVAPVSIQTYSGTLAEVVSNLLLNALRHAFGDNNDGGSINITVTEQDGGALIRLSDDGCGMTEEQVDKVFDPFFTTNPAKGTGLGAHIVYNQVTQKLNGSIRCSSTLGEGTIFDIFLPSSLPFEE